MDGQSFQKVQNVKIQISVRLSPSATITMGQVDTLDRGLDALFARDVVDQDPATLTN